MISSPYVVKDANGEQYIPASQRADGTWRKARKVKEGYVPQDEVPLYQSKGKQWAASRNAAYPVGLDPALIKAKETKEAAAAEKLRKQAAKKKVAQSPSPATLGQPKTAQSSSGTTCMKPSTPKVVTQPPKEVPKQKPPTPKPQTQKPPEASAVPVDSAKRLRNLKKKLKEIETLEAKINSKELKNPDKDQLDKVGRKKTIEDEILALELSTALNV